jgi:hypothetical protein
MCAEGLAIYSDLDNREFVLKNGDIDPALDGDTWDVMSGLRPAGKARLSISGKTFNIAISAYYYTVPLRSVLAVLDGRNKERGVVGGDVRKNIQYNFPGRFENVIVQVLNFITYRCLVVLLCRRRPRSTSGKISRNS